jgi:ABC-type multidrug transport system fused ATPase/permease subunit
VSWLSLKPRNRLWIALTVAHWRPLAAQWLLTLVQAVGNFGPQWVLLHILRILEQRYSGDETSVEAWIWVLALGLVTTVASWVESWLFWVSWSQLAIPVRAQLSALIFQKAMRRKDVKGKTNKKVTVKDADAPEINLDSGPNGETTAVDKPENEEEEDDGQKTKQSTVNLIGVDAKRISDFVSFNNYFPGSLFKLIVSFAFLLTLIGWQSLLAGLVVMCLVLPVNIYCSKKYAAAQDRLMKVRDTKMAVVTEALQGIRQIKFSALENQWQAKIGKVRDNELNEQWNVFAYDTWLMFCWITSPIMLSATSLATYAIIYGELTPSVAFTSIGVFRQLEVTLAVIPELTTDLIDAWVSIARIEKYLNSPEIASNTSDSPNISLEDATIAWPSDEEKEDGDQRYVLRNLNLSFPPKELSVISGKTGTGKSLLLASLLGEVDVLSGKVNVPKPPSIYDRHDDKATAENWIIDSSIAFVAQIPWIENASIKDNILFGLPFDEARYQKTIEVCALRKDLEMLTDGEKTEIGANGINLSGGQRWRVTFARALYSRAGILILDDIFSAVDATTGRYLFEKALCGPLGAGRTRILVTHHVALVKSKANYIVELGDGTVEHAGLMSEIEDGGILKEILSHESPEVIKDDEDATAVNSEESSDIEGNGEPLKKIDSKAAAKFVEEEAREKGRVKKDIYIGYIKSCGGWPFCIVAIIVFFGQQALTLGKSFYCCFHLFKLT